MQGTYERFDREFNKALGNWKSDHSWVDESQSGVSAEAGTGSMYCATLHRLLPLGEALLGGKYLLTLVRPWSASYVVQGQQLHPSYFAEKFVPEWIQNGGDVAAAWRTCNEALALMTGNRDYEGYRL